MAVNFVGAAVMESSMWPCDEGTRTRFSHGHVEDSVTVAPTFERGTHFPGVALVCRCSSSPGSHHSFVKRSQSFATNGEAPFVRREFANGQGPVLMSGGCRDGSDSDRG